MAKQEIEYNELKHIILNCQEKRTQALMAFQYALGARCGELAREYVHEHIKVRRRKGTGKLINIKEWKDVSKGLLRSSFIEKDGYIECVAPNFKNLNKKTKVGYVLENEQGWLYQIIQEWLKKTKYQQYVFNVGASLIRRDVSAELKKYSPTFSSGHLRTSFAKHLAQVTGNPYIIKERLGHARLETSVNYVEYTRKQLINEMRGKTFDEIFKRKLA